ncbi:MAG: geranylgeranyl reductase family protein [Candidatus Thorarchaeota archaeon]|jgi:geranylgeranyl reductase family protein
MNQTEYDVIVVGGGPSGLISAHRVAADGHRVLVLEEHETIGEPDHCAGLLSVSGLNSIGLQPPEDVVQNHVMGARIYSPSGHHIYVERGQREALVIDRRKFDRWLANRAIDAGASIRTEAKVRHIRWKNGRIAGVQASGDESDDFSSSIVINAEGSRCQISKQAGLPMVPRSSKYPAFQIEVSDADVDNDIVEMYYGRSTAPGFFAWIIPLGDGRARVGLAAKSLAKRRLMAAIRHHPIMKERLRDASIQRTLGGVVLVGMPIKKTVKDNILVVGDAAGMVKPTTGGGVIVGGMAANVAGRIVTDALSNQDESNVMLDKYEGSWRSLLMRELRTMYMTQRLLSSFSDKGLDSLVRDAEQYGLIRTIRREGDMDMQRRVILRLLSSPMTLIAGLKAARFINPFF